MERRKLKFDVRKNCERKRKKTLELCPASCSLLVLLPISAYLSTEATDTALLHSRIVALQSLSSGWMFTNIHSNASLVIYKLQPVAAAAGLVFTVSLDHVMMWEVRVGDSVVSVTVRSSMATHSHHSQVFKRLFDYLLDWMRLQSALGMLTLSTST